MNLLERGIAAISPRWAASRAMSRLALAQVRAYAGARIGDPGTDGWIAPGSGPRSEVAGAAAMLRNRGRDLVRNNPYATRAVGQLASKCVGTGIIPRLILPDDFPRTRRLALRDAWDAFAETADPEGQTDYYGLQLRIARCMFESGECLVRLLRRPSRFGLRVPLQIQVLEPDYLDSGKTTRLSNGNAIIQGVEFDGEGRRVAYWLFPEHPGDQLVASRGSLASQRIPAAEVLHVFESLRPGQARGVSMFAPVVLRLRWIDDYQEAEIQRKILAAGFAAFVKTPKSNLSSLMTGQNAAPKTTKAGSKQVTIEGARIQRLSPEEEMQFPPVQHDAGYDAYMVHQLHAAAAGLGLTYAQLTGDLRKVNFSSARIGLNDFHDLLDAWQWLTLVPQMCRPIHRAVGALLVATGERGSREPWAAKWTPPKRRYLNPKDDVATSRDKIRAGLTTLFDEIAEQGEDAEEMIEERARQDALLDALGIRVDSDGRYFGQAGAGAPAGADTAATDSQGKDAPDDAGTDKADKENQDA